MSLLPTEGLTNRQRALYWLARAEASSVDERIMLLSTLARQIRCTQLDVIAVREVFLAGHTTEASR